jgi:uncharacterized membrane protein YkvA (DUF1232 family)
MRLFDSLRKRAHSLKVETRALCFACRDPRVPWYAKLLAACVVAYAFSPIDLIPDFIPVLGYLDDIVIVPLGLAVAVRMVPRDVLAECRKRAELESGKRTSLVGAAIVILIWLSLAAGCGFIAFNLLRRT